ncbi:hypothetical protein EYZ11_013030 [Aspergillus tanneri]|uniref:Integrase catalytic domain-containing protein n=1 Tax=Aspergillus tanneri TaxID=1220188 RepID=A0A4S3IYZ1_9EURO|nr:hypothetical protein EYZ11_013030 [Aspergillus tanneri]
MASLWPPRTKEKYFCATTTGAVRPEDYDKFMEGSPSYTIEELKQRVPPEYHKVLQVFIKEEADTLPPHRDEDHEIRLVEGSEPPFARNYRPMNAQECEVVKKYIGKELGKGFIRPSASPTAAPVLIVRKPNGGLRVSINYRALNKITIKSRYPIPLVGETLSCLSHAKLFTKLDVVSAFNRICIKEGQEWLTAFNTRYGQFEYLVMPFGLYYLDVFCTAYLDDVLVYSEDPKDHTEHVLKVLRRLLERGLHVDIDKCEFSVTQVKYLGLIVSTDGISMDPEKVEAIRLWERSQSVKDVQVFLGFAGFYRRFIPGFSQLTYPLNEVTKGSQTYTTVSGQTKVRYAPFQWTPECEKAFQTLKEAFTTAPILAYFDLLKETWVETNSSDLVTAGILSQMHGDILRPVAYFSKKISPAETNYMIYDKELLAIIRAFKTWRPELTSTAPENPVKVYSDHRTLEYFMTTKQLNRRQARWAEFLSEFNFKIMYWPGKQGQKPDTLTRRSQDLPKGFDDERERERFQTVLRENQLDEDLRKALCATFCANTVGISDPEPSTPDPPQETPGPRDDEPYEDNSSTEESEDTSASLETLINQAYEDDRMVQEVIIAKNRGQRKLPRIAFNHGFRVSMGELSVRDYRLWVGDRLYIPASKPLRHRILTMHHRLPTAGHPGPKNMYRRLLQNYFWPEMKEDCRQYGDFCATCRRSKALNTKKQGLLKPLPIPNRKWMDISMDYAEDLPPCTRSGRVYRHVLVVVDRLTKQRIFEPMQTKEVTELVEVMHRRVFSEYGLPRSIVSDRGRAFTSYFWRRYCARYKIKVKLSTAHHPETDGQSENAIKHLKNYLRAFINFTQDDWVDHLPDAQLAANTQTSESTGMTPFFANHGYHPRTGVEPPGMFDDPTHPQMLAADKLIQRTEEVNQLLQTELTWAQEAYERHANKYRQPHPAYQVGDCVFVDARHFTLQRQS